MNKNTIATIALFIFTSAFGAEKKDTSAMKKREKTDTIIIHHSATTGGNTDAIRHYHIQNNGWADIGYHFVICNGSGGKDGLIQKGRDEKFQGAHAGNPKPSRNPTSLGVCLIGTDKFTDAQKKSLISLLVKLCKQYKIKPSVETIQGHHEECPGKGLNFEQIIAQANCKLASPATHTVKAGETLSSIGRLYGQSWQELFAKNKEKLSDPNILPIGTVLKLK